MSIRRLESRPRGIMPFCETTHVLSVHVPFDRLTHSQYGHFAVFRSNSVYDRPCLLDTCESYVRHTHSNASQLTCPKRLVE
jgi:hypothetical protein